MAETRFHSLLKERVREEINKITADLARGAANDHSEYKLIVGRVVGMETCLAICDDIEKEHYERSHST